MRFSTLFLIVSLISLLLLPTIKGDTYSGLSSSLIPHLEWNRTWEKNESVGEVKIGTGNNGDIFVGGGTSWTKPSALLLSYDTSGKNLWNKTWTKGTMSQVLGMAIDDEERIYITIGSDADGGLYCYDSSGNYNWSKNVSGFYKSVICSSNSLFIAGGNNDNASIVRLNLSGNVSWDKEYDTGVYETINGITLAHDNRTIYGTGIIGSKYGQKDVLIVAYDINGTYKWSKTWGGSSEDSGTGIAVDSNNNVYVCGWTESYGVGINDVLLLKYDSTGNFKWYKTWGTVIADDGNGICIHNDSIYITGSTDTDAILLKYNTSGTLQWNTTWRTVNIQISHDVYVNKSGEIYVAGSLSYTTGTPMYIYILKYIEVPDGAPEFVTILLPIATVIALFVIVTIRKRRKRDLYERNY